MNWSKIKNIMIIILIIINLFLVVNIAFSRYMSQSLPDGVAESFISILSKSGITIEKQIVPSAYEVRSIITAEAYDIDRLTEIFIGKKVNYVSQGQSLVALGDDKKLSVTGEQIEYTTLKESVDKNGRDILSAIDSIGLGKKGMYYDDVTGYVKLKVDAVGVEGIYLDVYLDANGEITSLTGVWPKITIRGSDEKVSVVQAVNSICNIMPEGSHITNIEKIYVLEDGYEVKYAWRVYNQGRGYVCYLR